MSLKRGDSSIGEGMRCVVDGCRLPVTAEVHIDDYGEARRLFYGRGLDRKTQSRRAGDARIFACQYHLDCDGRMRQVRWQSLLAFTFTREES